MSEFYMVSFEQTGDFYFFRHYENAYNFLLDSYYNDNNDISDTEIEEISQQISNQSGIEYYGWIDVERFED